MVQLVLALLVLSVVPAAAQDWTVYYITYENNTSHYFGIGSYLTEPTGPVYVQENNRWVYLGQYGQAKIPSDAPKEFVPTPGLMVGIERTGGGGGGGSVVGAPEFSVLRRLPRLPAMHGQVLKAKLALRQGLQHATAFGATHLLRGLGYASAHRGVFVDLPSVTLEVTTWCSGTAALKLMLLLALGVALALRPGVTRACVIVGAAAVIALEVNILRVASIGVAYEHLGRAAWGWKETLGAMATALGVVQLIGLGWWSRVPREVSAV